MTKFRTGLAIVAALLVAAPTYAADLPGAMKVMDDAGLFSSDAKSKAESKMSEAKFDRGLHFSVDTYKAIPADRRSGFSRDMSQSKKDEFFRDWAKAVAKGDKEKGPYVLICMDPGRVEVIVDQESQNRGFNSMNRDALRDIFLKALKAADGKATDETRPGLDQALQDATAYVTKKSEKVKDATGRSLGGWICLGLSILLGAWLVIGLIRAFTGGGGGGGGGGGYGGGGGGGGFGTSLMGGLFGAMAGMWLYNNMFGGGMMGGGYGSDAYASDGMGGNADTGAGNYDGGGSSGGDFDGGGGGGGDFGGGGGDFGGGGGGDWGGGGDF